MMGRQNKEIPVYVFMGFLESGKTTFAKETLMDRGFTGGAKTLLLVCEDGEEEYDIDALKKANIYTEFIEEDQLTTDHLLDLQDKYNPEQVMIEYNGMWKLDKIFEIRVPKGWTVVQVISFVNAETYDVYSQNMKATMVEQFNSADMVIFNRCDENSKIPEWRRSIKAVNRRAQIIFEMKDGSVAPETNEPEDLPYDVSADVIELPDDDFGIWYVDAYDHPDQYMDKEIEFVAQAFRPKGMKNDMFVPVRKIMTCCADDVRLYGYPCKIPKVTNIQMQKWYRVRVRYSFEPTEPFAPEQPVLYLMHIEPAEAPEQDYVYLG
mgnify:CR=1 FL=1